MGDLVRAIVDNLLLNAIFDFGLEFVKAHLPQVQTYDSQLLYGCIPHAAS